MRQIRLFTYDDLVSYLYTLGLGKEIYHPRENRVINIPPFVMNDMLVYLGETLYLTVGDYDKVYDFFSQDKKRQKLTISDDRITLYEYHSNSDEHERLPYWWAPFMINPLSVGIKLPFLYSDENKYDLSII